MKLLLDFLPIALFFISYKLYGVKIATAVMIVASIIQIAAQYHLTKKIEKMHLISLGMVVVLGGMTILLDDKRFVMWKPTIFNWAIAVAFAFSALFTAKPIIQRLMESQMTLPVTVWHRLNWSWVGLFIVIGAANLGFAQNYLATESQLRQAVPELTSAQLDQFNCVSDVPEQHMMLCNSAKEKETLWVNFKLFGVLGLIFVFIVAQTLFLGKYIQEDEKEAQRDTDAP